MKSRTFALQPFPPARTEPRMEITGQLLSWGARLAIRFLLNGSLTDLAIPTPATLPARRDGLWENTCFELFLAVPGSAEYWEFNLSPSGHWQVYRFTGYRQGRQEEPAFTALPFEVQQGRDTLGLALEFDLSKIGAAEPALEAAVAAVIKSKAGETTFWALTHRGPRPDFHRRDSFIILRA